jgi:hypothetical protein
MKRKMISGGFALNRDGESPTIPVSIPSVEVNPSSLRRLETRNLVIVEIAMVVDFEVWKKQFDILQEERNKYNQTMAEARKLREKRIEDAKKEELATLQQAYTAFIQNTKEAYRILKEEVKPW